MAARRLSNAQAYAEGGVQRHSGRQREDEDSNIQLVGRCVPRENSGNARNGSRPCGVVVVGR